MFFFNVQIAEIHVQVTHRDLKLVFDAVTVVLAILLNRNKLFAFNELVFFSIEY